MIVSFEWWIDALWRNGLALVPVALLAWLAVQLMARRPATRHVIWLGALSWLVVGILLPPLPSVSNDSTGTDLGNENTTTSTKDFFSNSSLIAEDAFVETVESSEQVQETLPESVSLVRASFPDWESDWQRSESLTARDISNHSVVELTEREKEKPVRSKATLGDERSQYPTPPTAIARSSRQPSHVFSSMVGPVGQSSPTISSATTPPETDGFAFEGGSLADESSVDGNRIAADATKCDIAPVDEPNDAQANAVELPPINEGKVAESVNLPASRKTDARADWLLILQRPFIAVANVVRNWSRQLTALPRLPWQIWLTITFGIIAWRLLFSIRFSLSLKQARPAPHDVQALVNECAALIGLRNAPTAHLVGQRVSPLILCYPRPRLIIPVELWSELDADSRRVVILHELAHLKRRDHWTHGFNELLGALYWWHPLVWWMRRRIADEAENACDMWVTWLAPKSRRAYATALIQTQQFLTSKACTPTPASAVGILSPQAQRIARRLTMIMTHRNAPRSSSFGFLCVPALLLAAWVTVPAHSQTAGSIGVADDAVVAEAPKPATVVAVGSGSGIAVVAPKAGALPEVAIAVRDDHDHGHAHAHAHAGGGGRAHVRHRAGNDDERMARLEAQIARLAAQVEQLSVAMDQRAVQNVQSAPKLPGQAPAGLRIVETPLPPKAPRAVYPGQQNITRRYQLPAGKREALNNLMRRSDVPVYMRPRPDGIELIGTAAQHEVFERFVLMLGGKGMDHKTTYEIDKGQMDDLKTLMIRDDVPVLVSPHKNRITVHGNELIQKTFKDFVEMIAPKGTKPVTIRTAAPNAFGSVYQDAHARDVLRAKEAAERARREAQVAREYAAVRSSMKKSREQVKRRAHELEAKADQMQARAEMLQAQYDEVKTARQQANADQIIAELDRKLAEILAVKRDLEAQAEALYDAAAEAEAEIDELEEELEDLSGR